MAEIAAEGSEIASFYKSWGSIASSSATASRQLY